MSRLLGSTNLCPFNAKANVVVSFARKEGKLDETEWTALPAHPNIYPEPQTLQSAHPCTVRPTA